MFQGIDLFSDTLTQPTSALKEAMMAARVGDEQKGEDPTTLKLEQRVASLLGKGSALFLPSATMANQIAIMVLVQRGEELLAAENAHVFVAEAGGAAFHAGAQTVPVAAPTGKFDGEAIRKHFRSFKGPHLPITSAVAVENTTNLGGGLAWTREELDSVLDTSKELSLKTHLDGSRLFNASLRSGLSPSEIASLFDTVTVCFSKGLGCPMGALLAFDPPLFHKIRRLKQVMGGSLRQSGMLAAAALYSLDHYQTQLAQDHDNAHYLASHLKSSFPALSVDFHPLSTNMVFFSWLGKAAPNEFYTECLTQGLRFSQMASNRFRAVIYQGISREDIDKALSLLKKVCNSL